MMKHSRKIVASIAMLLVSAIMLGTASYAWFAMNTRSNADGLTVEAYTDSNFLEISQTNDENAVFGINTTFKKNNTGVLRLVTNKRFNASEMFTLTATAASGNYLGSDEDSKVYYKAVKADTGVNYIYANDELKGPSSTAGYFKGATFTLVVSDAKVTGDYYKLVKNEYVKVTLDDASAKGYYKASVSPVEADGSVYDGQSTYYSHNSATGTFTKVSNLQLGTDLSNYYTVETETVTITDNQRGDAATKYYLKNGNDYSYVGTISNSEFIKNYIYWGRAYSNDPAAVQANNTLNIIDKAASKDYYLQQTLYLRQAEGTNLASNLRVEEIRIGGATNDLHGALRVLLVATSSSDPNNIVTSLYDAGTGTFDNQLLFAKLLGNEAETITVQVYIYYDGTDEVSMNTTMVGATLNGQSVEIEFAIDELPYNQ